MAFLNEINVYTVVKFKKSIYQKLIRIEITVYLKLSPKIYFTKSTVLDPASLFLCSKIIF